MKQARKGFMLFEVTIVTIFGAIAFISFQGYSRDAHNSKIISDIRKLVTAVEVGVADGRFTLDRIVVEDGTGTLASGTFWSGVSIADYGKIWSMDFTTIWQVGHDFRDPIRDSSGNNYVVAHAESPVDARNTFYQIAGQVHNTAGSYEAIVRGNYIRINNDIDAVGLIAGDGYAHGLINGDVMPVGRSSQSSGLYWRDR